jgi:hypothetical protein
VTSGDGCPPEATLLTAWTPLEASWIEEQASALIGDPPVWIPTDHEVAEGVRALTLAEPDVITYACTSGSFCGPPDNERRIRDVMTDAGAKLAQTTNGALLDALHAIGATSVAVGTPYRTNVTDELGAFLVRAGYGVASLIHEDPAPGEADAHLTEESMLELALRADRADADVVFLSCAALENLRFDSRARTAVGEACADRDPGHDVGCPGGRGRRRERCPPVAALDPRTSRN